MSKKPDTHIVPGLPDPGENRFWHGVHRPSSVKEPLLLELREKQIPSAEHPTLSLSYVIAKAGTVADTQNVIKTAQEILARASHVKEFTGVLAGE